MREKPLTRDIATVGLLIAMQIILLRFLSIQTVLIRIDFAFIPIAFGAMLYGPLKGGIAAATGDVVSFILFPPPFPFFPGFTITAFLVGVVYGLFLYRKPKTLVSVAVPVVIIALFLNLGLDTFWIIMIAGQGIPPVDQIIPAFIGLMPVRIIRLVMVPVQIVLITFLWKYVMEHLKNQFAIAVEK